MTEKRGYNRRDFLKIVGAGAGVAAAGCGQKLPEKFIPYVIQPDEVVPGVSTWYSGSCSECSAGCGTLIRTREGRALKVEGNPQHPINSGGLCTHGQSALQGLYDPDRVREPLKRDVGGSFQPISWKDGIDAFATAVADANGAGKEVVLLTRPTSGSELALIDELAKKIPNFKHLEYEFQGGEIVDRAAEQVFGPGLRTRIDLSKANTIVGFGADYLETWISPCEYSRDWAAKRKAEAGAKVSRVIHFEPRLSLTAGNADHWIMNAPGTESSILLALLKLVVGQKTSSGASSLQSFVKGLDVSQLLSGTGVKEAHLQSIAKELVSNGPSLVLAGGATVSGAQSSSGPVLANLLNVALDSVGHAESPVQLYRSANKLSASFGELNEFFDKVASKERKVGVLIVSGVNPAYIFPAKSKFKAALAQIPTLVGLATQLDETSTLSTLVFPLSHQIETWSDSEPRPGVYNINQPAMQPLYQSQSLGDTLIALAANAKLKNAKFEDISSFYDYIRARWKSRVGETGFEARWIDLVEKGGDWSKAAGPLASWSLVESAVAPAIASASALKAPTGLAVLAYPSVNSFDGSSANKSWLQELPNPISSAVWGSWIEIHPDVAKEAGVATGDVIQVAGSNGFIEAPAYVTKYIHPSLLAVPLGQGHESYGRFATGVGVNALQMMTPGGEGGAFALLSAGVKIRPGIGKESLVRLQGSDSQYQRGIGRTISVAALAEKMHGEGHAAEAEEPEGGEENPLALGPRPVPKQMYRQMSHEALPYHWGMNIDLSSCTGCSACVVACYAENNVPVVGKTVCDEGREMSWLRIERYLDGPAHRPIEGFVPMMCQHCQNAPCEPVCPVYATYHTEEGLNSMVYNRCVGTRYCLNNCSYKVRRFNWYKYAWAEPLQWQLNPDVTVREVGVMEKCSFCIQRIREAQSNAKDLGRLVKDGEIQPACASSCPTKAISFGNLNDHESVVAKRAQDARVYKVLDTELNTQPVVTYLARVVNDANVG